MSDARDDLAHEIDDVDDERLRVGVEYFAARKSGFATEEQLRADLAQSLPADVDLQSLLDQLSEPAHAREATAFVVTQLLTDENDNQEIREDIDQAADKLAVVETALGVLLIMYAIHYVATGGVASEEVTRKLPDGTVEKRSTTYQKPTEWLKTLVDLFGFTRGDKS